MWEKVKEIIGMDIESFDRNIIEKAKNNDLLSIFKLARLYDEGLKIKKAMKSQCSYIKYVQEME